MPLTREVARLIAEGNSLEEAGRYRQAEAAYLQAIAQLGGGDEELVGTISINLGSNAVTDGRSRDAIRFYSRAIRALDGLKGEALLQTAHAHYNLARVYLRS